MNLKSKLAGKAMLPLLVTLIVGLAGGVLISNYTILGQSMGQSTGNTADSSRKTEKEILYWVAPMDPTYRRDEPGKSPMGMDLVPVYAEQGADSDAVHVSAAVEQSLGVRTSKAERRSLWRKV